MFYSKVWQNICFWIMYLEISITKLPGTTKLTNPFSWNNIFNRLLQKATYCQKEKSRKFRKKVVQWKMPMKYSSLWYTTLKLKFKKYYKMSLKKTRRRRRHRHLIWSSVQENVPNVLVMFRIYCYITFPVSTRFFREGKKLPENLFTSRKPT